MKKVIIYFCAFLTAFSMTSCDGMIEEQNYGNPTIEDMMTPENVILTIGQAYADVKWLHDHWGYWGVSSLTSDECCCPVRLPEEHWADGGYWKNLNTHKWNEFADAFKNVWNSTIAGAVLCNKLSDSMKKYKENFTEKQFAEAICELEVLRSYYYFLLFDCFGRIPYLEEFVEKTDEPLTEATEVWSRLVVSLEKNAPNMTEVTDGNRAKNYGRVTRGFAYTLLARLYLNAESYGCTPDNISISDEEYTTYGISKITSADDFYRNAIRCCDKVIESESYKIEDDWFANFAINNENSKENIFVIVENGNADFDFRYNGSMANKLRLIALSLHYCHQDSWGLIEKPWNGFCARPSFIERYNDWDVRGPGYEGKGTKDTKRWGWFYGPIYDEKGEKILQDKTDKVDAIITKDIVLHKDAKSDDPLSGATWNSGARLLKYEVDKAKENQWAENDFVLFRYADVLWMREEAAVRCGADRISSTSEEFKKMLSRTFAYSEDPEAAYKEAYGDVSTWTLEQICDERGREFAWENMRRRDLIRFGKFNDPEYVEFVNEIRETRNWFPIPYSVLEKSLRDENGEKIWTQNEGYE
ncbi:MAG: RagB/SusD family nutrient uptake outer membrane protein [Bacteroidales bacterium]|nr:RagB/SusD family nutrient uptake outer membrane protein [Bacteroidales bacterium]